MTLKYASGKPLPAVEMTEEELGLAYQAITGAFAKAGYYRLQNSCWDYLDRVWGHIAHLEQVRRV